MEKYEKIDENNFILNLTHGVFHFEFNDVFTIDKAHIMSKFILIKIIFISSVI